jgi:uncharacterized Zn-finger protein
VGSRNSVGPDGEALGRKLLAERWREMQMESYPKFQNEIGVPIVRIGCHEFECIGDKPPQDHPHIYLNMGDASDIVCPYCSTLFRFDPTLGAHEADPADCEFGDVD